MAISHIATVHWILLSKCKEKKMSVLVLDLLWLHEKFHGKQCNVCAYFEPENFNRSVKVITVLIIILFRKRQLVKLKRFYETVFDQPCRLTPKWCDEMCMVWQKVETIDFFSLSFFFVSLSAVVLCI